MRFNWDFTLRKDETKLVKIYLRELQLQLGCRLWGHIEPDMTEVT